MRIVGLACSLRTAHTTTAAVCGCLDAAKSTAPNWIEVELIEWALLTIPAGPAAGLPSEPRQADDFPALVPKLADPQVAAILIGHPSTSAT